MASKKKIVAAPFIPARQGDVLILRDDTLKPGAELAPTNGRVVLAIGETSGHCHAIDARHAKLFELFGEVDARESAIDRAVDRMLVVLKKTVMRVESTATRAPQDERHTPVELPPGTYRVRVMGEYTPGAIRSTAD